MYHSIPKEKLDRWWFENKRKLEQDPSDFDAIALEVLLENEYQRLNQPTPEDPAPVIRETVHE